VLGPEADAEEATTEEEEGEEEGTAPPPIMGMAEKKGTPMPGPAPGREAPPERSGFLKMAISVSSLISKMSVSLDAAGAPARSFSDTRLSACYFLK
jgi:hypothetical protein